MIIDYSRRDPLHGLRKDVHSPVAPFVRAFFMLRIIAIVIIIAIVAVLGFTVARPNVFRVQYEINIKASPEKVFILIDDFHH